MECRTTVGDGTGLGELRAAIVASMWVSRWLGEAGTEAFALESVPENGGLLGFAGSTAAEAGDAAFCGGEE